MEQNEQIRVLFANYLAGRSSSAEVDLLLQYFNAHENEALLKSLILEELQNTGNTNAQDVDRKAELDILFGIIKKRMLGNN